MMVDENGRIVVPFAGSILAAGRTPTEIERIITARLTGKAHQPQVIVRRSGNATSDITVMGEVTSNIRVPLTPKGERLLDALAAAGGVRQQSAKTLIQVARGDRVAASPLDVVLRDPAQNIRLQSSDVVTAIYQPFSFTSMGATGASTEVPFEAVGINLSQALGRMSGLREDRANVRGVFVFRFENPAELAQPPAPGTPRTPDGRVPVIYRADLSDPRSLFLAQRFPIKNTDIVYVTSAPASDLQRFVSMVSSIAFTVIGFGQAIP
jgi:polysaccharide export outer membrane protein